MHLYFHIPFCARRCSYCDFAIAVRRTVPSEAYADAVLVEWESVRAHSAWAEAPGVQTIYFGGGTPSRLDPGAVARILARVRADRGLDAGAEVTLEANPDDVTRERAAAWRQAGITRVSLGAQSFDSAVLRWMHRTHTAGQVADAVGVLRGQGIGELSLDLIFGLPASLTRDWARDLDAALALAPDHLSLYGLTIEGGTPLAHWTARGQVRPTDDESYAAEYLAAHSTLVARGWDHYEVSSAGRPGHRARHNSAYWRRAPYVGLGPSAHSGIGAERWWNVREWAAYAAALGRGESAVAGRESLDPAAVRLEELYLGLRTREGISTNRIAADDAAAWVEAGWAVREGDRLRLTAEGWLRLDALVAATPTGRGTV
ncbi:MAG TPA: radical SAM family heme chaperone HemW [Gemmatimonadales bacterium]|nr:radical SAM family heme chaperone HemW [Gemmatimonadales bacterium]